VPIPGGAQVEHLDDNLAAAGLQLSQGDMREIDAAFARIDIKGAALSEALDSAIVRWHGNGLLRHCNGPAVCAPQKSTMGVSLRFAMPSA
jgi:hypothetical protein